jgi:hypothetical protein
MRTRRSVSVRWVSVRGLGKGWRERGPGRTIRPSSRFEARTSSPMPIVTWMRGKALGVMSGKWVMADVMFGRRLVSGKARCLEKKTTDCVLRRRFHRFRNASKLQRQSAHRNRKPRAEKTGTHVLQHLDLSHQPFQPIIILTFQLVRCPRVTC